MKNTLIHRNNTLHSSFYTSHKYRPLASNNSTIISFFRRYLSIILLFFVLSFSLVKAQDSTVKTEIIPPHDAPSQLVHIDFPSETLMHVKNIECGEDKSTRWISVSLGSDNSTHTPIVPIYEADAVEGSFSLELIGVDPTTYTDSRLVRDHGNYPIQYQVITTTPRSMVITGITIPYDSVNCYYSFNQNKYYYAFMFNRQLEGSYTKSPAEKLNGILSTSSKGHPAGSVKSPGIALKNVAMYASIFRDSELIIGFVLVTIFIAVCAFLIGRKMSNRKHASAQDFAGVLEEKTSAKDTKIEKVEEDPQLSEKNLHEKKIRGLMESKKISYDEAALRVQYDFIEYSNA